MNKRPDACRNLNLVDKQAEKQAQRDAFKNSLTDDQLTAEMKRKYEEYEKSLKGMDRRAHTAEVILGLVFVLILSCACMIYFGLYGKKKAEADMQSHVNEQVAQYFTLSQNDDSKGESLRTSIT